MKDGADYYGNTDFEVAYNYRGNVTLDGNPVTLNDNGFFTIPADNAEHTVSLTDLFGNAATYTIGVYKTYKVTFVADGIVIAEKLVNHGAPLNDIPAIPAKPGYDQTAPSWDVTDFKNITSDITVTAVYEKNSEIPPEEKPPETGDDSGVWLALLGISIGAVFVIAVGKKRWINAR